jgi:enoyl-CoA hydratase/carnithine racemase
MALVQKSVEASVGTITLDHREKHNALSGALIAGLVQSGARVVVLRAPQSARVKSAGHDVRELPIWVRAAGRSASAPAGCVLCAVPRPFVSWPTERLRPIMKKFNSELSDGY